MTNYNLNFEIVYFDNERKYGIVTINTRMLTDNIKYRLRRHIRIQFKQYLLSNYKRRDLKLYVQYFQVGKIRRVIGIFYFVKHKPWCQK